MKLIGLHGHAGAGKNTFAEEFHYAAFFEYAFAAPVKAVCMEVFGLSHMDFVDRARKEEVIDYWNKSPRELAQYVGTEMFRNHFGSDIWIKSLEARLIRDLSAREDKNRKVLITDVRFQNEADWITKQGGWIIHLTRPGYEGNVGISSHASEQTLDFTHLTKGENYHKILNEGSITDLQLKAQQFISLYQL